METDWWSILILLTGYFGSLGGVDSSSSCPSRLSVVELNQLRARGRLLIDQQQQNLWKFEEESNSQKIQRRRRDRMDYWDDEEHDEIVHRQGFTRSFCRKNEGFVSIFTFLILSFNFFFGLSGILNYKLRATRRPVVYFYNSTESNEANSAETRETVVSSETTQSATVGTALLSSLASEVATLGSMAPSVASDAAQFFRRVAAPLRQAIKNFPISVQVTV